MERAKSLYQKSELFITLLSMASDEGSDIWTGGELILRGDVNFGIATLALTFAPFLGFCAMYFLEEMTVKYVKWKYPILYTETPDDRDRGLWDCIGKAWYHLPVLNVIG